MSEAESLLKLYRKSRQSAIPPQPEFAPGSAIIQPFKQLMSNLSVLAGKRLKRIAILVPLLSTVLVIVACGGSGAPTTAVAVQNAAFISNTYTGNLQIVNTQNDTTAYTQETTNSAGQVVPGAPVTITVSSTTVSFEVLSPDKSTTLVYDPASSTLWALDNSTDATSGQLPLVGPTSMAVFSPNSSTAYVPVPSAPVSGARNGLVQVWTVATATNVANYTVPAANSVAVTPDGQYLLVFSNNSDSVTVVNTTASPVTYASIPGFARPVNAFFAAGSDTAYVINCGQECGSTTPASVTEFDVASQTIVATVPVGGASVGLLSGTTLYVAGSPPVPAGTTPTFDAVNIATMTRLTANSVPISDGFHTTMALAQNNKLYIGASTCSNTTAGCLSVVNVSSNTADPPLPPRGNITSLLAITGRNVVYAIEGGYLHIYDTSTDTLQGTQITFIGALYGIVQVN
jgi:YVTN family beta-propeller protein